MDIANITMRIICAYKLTLKRACNVLASKLSQGNIYIFELYLLPSANLFL